MDNLYTLVRAVKGHGYEFKCNKTGRLVVYPQTQIVGSCKQNKSGLFKLLQCTMYPVKN